MSEDCYLDFVKSWHFIG